MESREKRRERSSVLHPQVIKTLTLLEKPRKLLETAILVWDQE